MTEQSTRCVSRRRSSLAALLGAVLMLAFAFPTFALTANVADAGHAYDAPTPMYDGAANSVYAHTGEAAPAMSHDGSNSLQGSVATIAEPLSVVVARSVAAEVAARTEPSVGQPIYRVYGGDSPAGGASWTPVNPRVV